jgi:predicted component of type VI protein secretion system
MIVKLVVQIGRKRGKVLTLRKPEVIFGRGPGNEVRIPSGEVSRKHCRLHVRDGSVTIEDLDSLNGTYVNDQRVNGILVVHSGDLLKVGPVRFLVEYEEEAVLDVVPAEDLDDLEVVEHPSEYDVDLAEEPPAGKGKKSPAYARKATQVEKSDLSGKTMPPQDEVVPVLPLADEGEAAPTDQVFTIDDQAWELPDPDKLRDILQELDKDNSPPEEDS